MGYYKLGASPFDTISIKKDALMSKLKGVLKPAEQAGQALKVSTVASVVSAAAAVFSVFLLLRRKH